MTENEYILATDLRTVYILMDVMRRLHPLTKHIPDDEHRQVGEILQQWQDRLNNTIKIQE